MRADDWKRLTQPILGSEWRTLKSLLYHVPVGWILYGLLGESSAATTSGFYIWIVRMPLFVPCDVIDLNWSDRFGESSRVHQPGDSATAEALRNAALQARAESEAKSLLLDPPGGADNVRMQEARGYGLLLEGNMSGAIEVLGRVARYAARHPWERELVGRASEVRSMLQTGGTGDVLKRLAVWRQETMTALGITPE